MSGWALRLALALAVAAPTQAAAAQNRFPRQWLFAAGGAAFGLGVTAVYSSGRYNRSIGWCASPSCVGIVSTLTGTLVGLLIGHEADQKYNLRYRVAPPLDLPNRSRSLRTRASGMDLAGGLIAVSGDDGVELVSAGQRLDYVGHRARGLRDIADVGVRPESGNLFVGTGTGLYLYSLTAEVAGARTLGGDVSAVAVRGGRVAVAAPGGLRIGAVVGGGGGDSVVWRSDSSAVADRVTDLRWQSDTTLWVLTQSALAAYRTFPDSAPARLGTTELKGSLRRLAVVDSLVAVAAGSEGVYVLRTADPALPRIAAHWSEPRYVYDVAFWGGLVYAAAGPEGLYVLKLQESRLEAVGLARNVGFVAALGVGPDALYALDRASGVVRRLEPPASSPPSSLSH